MTERAIPPVGTMTDRVQLKRREMTDEDEGGHLVAYIPIATVWARVRTISGHPGTDADGRAVTLSHAVVLRFRSDLKPGDRVTYRERALDIVSIAHVSGRRRYIGCLCSERAVTG